MEREAYAILKELVMKWPTNQKAMDELSKDLEKINLEYLLIISWNIMSESYVWDFDSDAPIQEVIPEVQGQPESWIIEMVGKAYTMNKTGINKISQRSTLYKHFFMGKKNLSHRLRIK
jgi:hypothetical protein